VETRGQVKAGWPGSDRSRLFALYSTVTLSGVGAGIPFINAILFLAGLIALIILTVRYGYWLASVGCLVAVGLCLILYGINLVMGYMILVVGPGLLMSYKARSFSEPYKVLLWGMLPYLLPVIALIAFYPYIIAQTPTLLEELHRQLAAGGGIFGLSGSSLDQAVAATQKTFEVIMRLAPGIFFTMFAAIALFGYMGAASIGARFGAIMPAFSPMSSWRASELWLIPLGAALVCLLLGGGTLKPIGENLLVFMVHLYALYGICLVEHYFKKSLTLGWLRAILYVLFLTVAVVIIPLLAFLGLVDSRFDLRKMDVNKASSG
jgi:uncharacterized protein YybS (DUF2232 family)